MSRQPKQSVKKRKKPKKEPSPLSAAGKDICLAIMPFGGYFDDYYLRVFKPGIEEAGLEPHRADDLFRPGSITNDICAYTRKAKIVLADLTERNPNVFYELGLAHAIGKPAILVVDDIDSVPFDLRNLRVIEYDKNDPTWGEKLRESITKAIQETAAAPLTSVLPAFIEIKHETKKPELGERDRELLDLRQQVEMLRRDMRLGRRDHRSEIGPEEAKAIIRDSLARGVPVGEIIRRLRPLGPPPDWIERQVDQMQAKEPKGAEPASMPESSKDPGAA